MPDAREAPGVRFWVACYAAVLVAGLVVWWPSLGYGWNWDDLHLIRPYSRAEIIGTFHGPWDPDQIETSGFRPMTT
jgi:hypothetical protein